MEQPSGVVFFSEGTTAQIWAHYRQTGSAVLSMLPKNQGCITINELPILISLEQSTLLHHCITITKTERALPVLPKFTSTLPPQIK